MSKVRCDLELLCESCSIIKIQGYIPLTQSPGKPRLFTAGRDRGDLSWG